MMPLSEQLCHFLLLCHSRSTHYETCWFDTEVTGETHESWGNSPGVALHMLMGLRCRCSGASQVWQVRWAEQHLCFDSSWYLIAFHVSPPTKAVIHWAVRIFKLLNKWNHHSFNCPAGFVDGHVTVWNPDWSLHRFHTVFWQCSLGSVWKKEFISKWNMSFLSNSTVTTFTCSGERCDVTEYLTF